LTVATAVLLLVHVTARLVAFVGITVAVSVSVAPTLTARLVLFRITPVTAIGFTVTTQVDFFLPSVVVTVIVALPAAFPVTTPLELTVATAVLLLAHVTALFVAFVGATVAVSAPVDPTLTGRLVLFRFTLVTAIGFTVTAQVDFFLPSVVVTVMVALPATFPVTTPLELTVATVVLLLAHVTALFVAFVGATVAVSVPVDPTLTGRLVLFRFTLVTEIDVFGTGLTVTWHVAVFPPSAVFTVIVALPTAFPVTTPLELTVATAVLLLVHVTVLFVAFVGITVAVSVSVAPTLSDKPVLFRFTPVTGTDIEAPGITVTLHVAILPPSAVFTVIVALPMVFPVTTPLELTVATAVLLLVHVTVLFVVFVGITVAVSVSVTPTLTDRLVLLRLTPATGTPIEALGITVTPHVAILPPSAVFTVIVALPMVFPVTTPLELTVATAALLLDHVTVLFAAFDGATVALSVSVAPTITDNVVLSRLTPVTSTGFTVTLVVAVFPPSAVFAVIIAVPTLFPVTIPSVPTVATAVLLLVHVIF
jgi:hypothetical protein